MMNYIIARDKPCAGKRRALRIAQVACRHDTPKGGGAHPPARTRELEFPECFEGQPGLLENIAERSVGMAKIAMRSSLVPLDFESGALEPCEDFTRLEGHRPRFRAY